MSHEKRLPLDEVEVDRSFIADFEIDLAHSARVESVITMSQAFGYDVVAEGVETQAQYLKLKQMNCDMFQGYGFAKPRPIRHMSHSFCAEIQSTYL
jgi:EAL domain-containing protein (putative c-di-GMP-specific phosphodiesterase class I)